MARYGLVTAMMNSQQQGGKIEPCRKAAVWKSKSVGIVLHGKESNCKIPLLG